MHYELVELVLCTIRTIFNKIFRYPNINDIGLTKRNYDGKFN